MGSTSTDSRHQKSGRFLPAFFLGGFFFVFGDARGASGFRSACAAMSARMASRSWARMAAWMSPP